MPEHRGGVLAADLDGTVVGVNTFPYFVRFLTRRLAADRRPLALCALLGAGALRKLHLLDHRAFKHVVCHLGAYVPDEHLASWARAVLDEHGHTEVLELLQGWGGRTILTTAAPEVYADHLAAALGIHEVHASRVEGRGLINNEGSQKPVRLRAAGLDRVDVFITDDTVIDLPMAQLADVVYEVAPGGRMRRFEVPTSGEAGPS